ncbi:hypothetical protein GKO48_00635 [Candidatus Lucifugimonas marina]|uniref:Uncharacterized protein n=1 Tax=Candidatus Lucifugimonas marina TaxID=3038979 RepID=A0AAJ5ZBC5_9CHLR|nr:hypothetical protein [SAR202 cluster bacterium JH702]MDG0869506.1 hypothetical protein [SAR202 cluster bacterium JH639]WFG38173.1 hypothetical protein GKO48_00635 [SAR202 cluster bacterium JH1073]
MPIDHGGYSSDEAQITPAITMMTGSANMTIFSQLAEPTSDRLAFLMASLF